MQVFVIFTPVYSHLLTSVYSPDDCDLTLASVDLLLETNIMMPGVQTSHTHSHIHTVEKKQRHFMN